MKHPERLTQPGLKNLRTNRVLEKGICITVEPGIYFRDFLLEGKMNERLGLDSKYLKLDKIKEY